MVMEKSLVDHLFIDIILRLYVACSHVLAIIGHRCLYEHALGLLSCSQVHLDIGYFVRTVQLVYC